MTLIIDVASVSDPRIGPGIFCSWDTGDPTVPTDFIDVFVSANADHTVVAPTLSVSRFFAIPSSSGYFPLGLVNHPSSPFDHFDSAAWLAAEGSDCSIECFLHHATGAAVATGFRDNLLWYPHGDPVNIARFLVGQNGGTDAILRAVTYIFPSTT
jgi:hypothetical protein